jgi:hypothetical protein
LLFYKFIINSPKIVSGTQKDNISLVLLQKMGKYFNPPTANAAFAAGGLRLNNVTKYQELMTRLPKGYVLVGRFNRGLSHLMPLLPNENEYNKFMRQYNDGHLITYEFYAMPNSVFGISTTSGSAASTTSGSVASATSGTVASVTSGTAASTTSGAAASTTSDEAHYARILRINAVLAMMAGLVATCRNCKSEGQSGQKCPKKCGGYCI